LAYVGLYWLIFGLFWLILMLTVAAIVVLKPDYHIYILFKDWMLVAGTAE
jgi:hypothetical protein